jgi:PAS domain S-box-containing protein
MFGTAQDITDRRRAEEALLEAERKYRQIFENAGEGIFQTTPDGRFIAANPALARMYGFDSPDELIRSLRDISRQVYVDPVRREEFKSLLEEHGVVRGFEHQAFRRDGSKIWVSLNARAVYDAGGAIRYYEGTTQDINERKLAEARSAAFAKLARKLSGARTPVEAGRIIAQTAGDLFEWDSCNLDLYASDRDLVRPMLKMDRIDGKQTDVTGHCSDRAPTPRSRRVITHGAELLLREEPIQFDEDAIPFGDKSRPSASIMTVPIRHAERVIGLLSIQSYTALSYDTPALDNLQALADHCGEALNRIQAEQSLFESEARFRQMADHFEDVVWIADRAITQILYINPAYERVFGRSCESLYERLESFVEAVHPDDRARMERMLERQREGDLTSVEYRIVRPDGSVRWIQRRAFPIRNNDGEVYRVAGIAQDITERKRAEAALCESEERYRDLVENSRELIGTHDLDGLVLSANRATVEALGYDLNDFVGKMSIRDILAPEVRHQFDEYMAKVRRDGETIGIMSVQTSSGEPRLWEFYNSLRTEGVSTPIVRGMARDITERKLAERDMFILRRELELTMNSMEEGVHRVDMQGNIAFENPAAARMLGWEVHELLGRPAHLTMHHTRPDGSPYPRDECPIYATLSDGITRQVADEVFWRRDGTSFPVEYLTAPMRNDRNEIVAVVVTFRDITERKRAEESLQLFRNLIDQSNDAIEVIDPETLRFIDCNESAYRSLGYTREEFLTLTVFDIDPVVDRSSIAQLDEQINESGFATLQSVHLRKDGTTFPVEIDVKLIRLERVYRLAVVRDISARKQAEEALRESEERYRELFENAKDAIYVHDLSGRYVSVNRAAEQLIGFSREEILGKHYSNFVSPRDLKHVRTNLCRKLDDENETVYEVDVVNRDGLRIPVEVSSRLIYEKGVAVGVQGTARDISDRKRAQEALRIYSQRLIEAQEAERQKIARELHDEIGQVLTAVRINLQSIQRSCQTDECLPQLDDSVAIVDEALGRVRELSIELRPSLLDDLGLSAALRWYVDRYAQRTGIIARVLNGFREDNRLPRDLETACFRIAQEALTNVARHAQASNVSVQLERSRERMLLTIIDDGIGFDINELRKSASPAAALGLRGMEERALVLGGYIEIESGLECGTQIRATFPLNRK